MSKIRLEAGEYGWDYLLVNVDTEEDKLIQSDWNYPWVAKMFGWTPCECGYTDGTVDCEHKTATQMITEASNFLDDHIGEECENWGEIPEWED